MSLKIFCSNILSKIVASQSQNVFASSSLHTSSRLSGKINRMKDRTAMLRTVVKKEDGTLGERTLDVDSLNTV